MNYYKIAKKEYQQAYKILYAQQNVEKEDPALEAKIKSPNIEVIPPVPEVVEACKRLQAVAGDIFVDLSKITVSNRATELAYVQTDPSNKNLSIRYQRTVANVNFNHIVNIIKSKLPGAGENQIKEALIRELAHSIAHEAGHIKKAAGNETFASEATAEQFAQETIKKYDAKYSQNK